MAYNTPRIHPARSYTSDIQPNYFVPSTDQSRPPFAHTQSYPSTPVTPRRHFVPPPIRVDHQIPQFAPPPKTPTVGGLPTSTFIPNQGFQAGFSAPPLTPVHPKQYDNQDPYYISSEPLPQIPPPVQDIILFNPSSNDKSLYAFNTDVRKMAAQYGDSPQHQVNTENGATPGAAPGAAPGSGQMTFAAPPTEYIDPPPQEHEMQYAIPSDVGPDGKIHAPGQIAHPNQIMGPQKYKNSFCGCFSDIGTCCLGCWCPCMLYAKTNHRYKTIPASNLDDYEACNGHCAMWCVLSPVSWVFTMLQRTKIRDRYQLPGSPIGDCARAYYCPLCTLVQDDREMNERESESLRCAGPGSGIVGETGYKKPDGMKYQRSSVIG